MPDEIDAILAIKQFSGIHQTKLKWWLAYAGDGQGNIYTSQANYYLCRYPLSSSPAVEIYNNRINLQDGLRIIVGYTAYQPNLLQVLDVADQRTDTQDPADNPIGPGGPGYSPVLPHWVNHQYLGADSGLINWRQLSALGVFPTYPASLSVQIWPGTIPRPGTSGVNVAYQTIDLTSHVPVTVGAARYVLISYDSTGAVVVTDGADNAGGFAALTNADIPATPAGNWRSCAVVLFEGQTAIVETTAQIDFLDLRFPEETTAGTVSPGQISGATAQYQYIVTGATPFTPAWSAGFLNIATGKTLQVNNTLTLAGTSDGFTLTVPATGTAVLTSRTLTEGAGLAGNTYDLSANRTLALGAPSTLTSSTTNSASGTTHTHAITASPSLLGNGTAQYQYIVTGGSPFAPGYSAGFLNIASTKTLTVNDSMISAGQDFANVFTALQTIKNAGLQLDLAYDNANHTGLFTLNGGFLYIQPSGQFTFVEGDLDIIGKDLYFGSILRITDTVASYTRIIPQNDLLVLLSGAAFQIYNAANNKAYKLSHDGTYARLESVNAGGGDSPFAIISGGFTTIFDTSGRLGLGSLITTGGVTYKKANIKSDLLFVGDSSIQERELAALTASFISNTDASRKAKMIASVWDVSERTALTIEADGTNSITTIAAAQAGAYTTTAVDLTLTSTHHWVTVTVSGKTITLPAAATCSGREYIISALANNVIVDANASELINGSLTQILLTADTMQIKCNGTGWIII